MEPPTDYVGQQREREQAACAITGVCDQLAHAGGRLGNPDKWTALAISDTTNRAGASHGQNSQAAAEQLALTNCRRNGSLDCKSLLWGVNICLAIAISYPDGVYAWDNDPDRARAGSKALARCLRASGKNCLVQTTPCASDDPRWSSPLPLPPGVRGADVDPRTVGTWELSINPGRWCGKLGAMALTSSTVKLRMAPHLTSVRSLHMTGIGRYTRQMGTAMTGRTLFSPPTALSRPDA
jgi:Domain of unknown function (DUF4189)